MKDCVRYKSLIEKHLDGMISKDELSELHKHIQLCLSCRTEFERNTFIEDAVKQAFSSNTSPEQAGMSLVSRLSTEPDRMPLTHRSIVLLSGMRGVIAAGILLTVGVLLGFALDRNSEPSTLPLRAEVPIDVNNIEGTVLVKHEGSDVWHALEAGSTVYLGDTFHSAVKSACVLKLGPKSTLGLKQNSMLVLESYNGETHFRLEHGELDAALESPHPPFFISTPHGRVEALGTEFTVTVIDE
jgi:hypothetical protein